MTVFLNIHSVSSLNEKLVKIAQIEKWSEDDQIEKLSEDDEIEILSEDDQIEKLSKNNVGNIFRRRKRTTKDQR